MVSPLAPVIEAPFVGLKRPGIGDDGFDLIFLQSLQAAEYKWKRNYLVGIGAVRGQRPIRWRQLDVVFHCQPLVAGPLLYRTCWRNRQPRFQIDCAENRGS